jgi:hypothetical protein
MVKPPAWFILIDFPSALVGGYAVPLRPGAGRVSDDIDPRAPRRRKTKSTTPSANPDP